MSTTRPNPSKKTPMTLELELRARSAAACELCAAQEDLDTYTVPPATEPSSRDSLLACRTCHEQLEEVAQVDVHHWRCLNDSMWSEVPAVQVVAWRMLKRLAGEGWPQDLLDMLYLDEETLAWAEAGLAVESAGPSVRHRDSNGVELEAGDSVTIIKDLDVKGSSLTAKRGTAVRNISLVHDNPEQIEGRVEGQQIVLLTKFVKKAK